MMPSLGNKKKPIPAHDSNMIPGKTSLPTGKLHQGNLYGRFEIYKNILSQRAINKIGGMHKMFCSIAQRNRKHAKLWHFIKGLHRMNRI